MAGDYPGDEEDYEACGAGAFIAEVFEDFCGLFLQNHYWLAVELVVMFERCSIVESMFLLTGSRKSTMSMMQRTTLATL